MSTTAQFGIRELLENSGAVPPRYERGKWTCPECRRPALSVNLEKEVFCCFHNGCGFRGGVGLLRRRLGIAREWLPSEEYNRLRRQRARAHEAAQRLYLAVKARRSELLDRLRDLGQLEIAANEAGPACTETWDALALVYSGRPRILAELAIFEIGRVADLVQYLSAPAEARARATDDMLRCGGMSDREGRFVEVGG